MLTHGAEAERAYRRIRRAGVRSSLHALHPHMSSLHDEWQDVGWSPKQIPGVAIWLRGDLGITLNWSTVSAWADQSGNGNNATQPTAAMQPVRSTSINGQQCVSLTGATAMELPIFWSAAGNAKSLAVVGKVTVLPGTSTLYPLISLKNAANQFTVFDILNFAGYKPYSFIADVGSSALAESGCANALDTNAHAWVVSYNGGTNTAPASYSFSLDGTAQSVVASGSTNRTSTDLASIGARLSSADIGAEFAKVDVAEIIAATTPFSASTLGLMAAYFQQRYGVS